MHWQVSNFVQNMHESFPFLTGIAVAISTAANSSLVYSMSLAFPSLLASIQTFGSLYMFSVINLAATLFVIFFLPETKVSTSLSYETDIIVLPCAGNHTRTNGESIC